jgi:hypothetical protein
MRTTPLGLVLLMLPVWNSVFLDNVSLRCCKPGAPEHGPKEVMILTLDFQRGEFKTESFSSNTLAAG